MKKLRQSGIILFILFSTFCFSSCLNNDDNTTRTQQMELEEIDQYINNLVSAGYNVDTTELGIYYVRKQAGQGEYPKAGDTLTVIYAGYFIDGTLFDSSIINHSEGSITFNYMENRMIPGFEDGLKLMNKGTLMEMIIPSSLAYGAGGTLTIPAYASLIFVTEMKDIQPLAVKK